MGKTVEALDLLNVFSLLTAVLTFLAALRFSRDWIVPAKRLFRIAAALLGLVISIFGVLLLGVIVQDLVPCLSGLIDPAWIDITLLAIVTVLIATVAYIAYYIIKEPLR